MASYRTHLICLFLLLLLSTPLLAHESWLVPERFQVAVNTPLVLDITTGTQFPKMEIAVKPARIARAIQRLAGQQQQLGPGEPQPKSLRWQVTGQQEGVAVIGVQLHPWKIELAEEKVAAYFDEIDPPLEIRQAWEKQAKPRRWREAYAKHARTQIAVGKVGNDRSWAEPLGLGLEIVPLDNPLALRGGDRFKVRVLYQGKPLAGQALFLVGENGQRSKVQRTDQEGRAGFTATQPGRHMVFGTYLRPSRQTDIDWESDFTTLTLEVGPAR